ncbi:MAG TPA: M43 family zinc metalloprotease, partial [Oligoflexia bacterium]|nr:M43 family zinc metalloprotease [Oligoflexia bacterium]
HEVGHWLGLLHTSSGQCDGFFDDLISDTPREKTPESGNYCPVDRDSCPDLDGEDPVHNHMTYTADECRSEFTAGQVDFMVFNASIFRSMQLY